MSVHSKMNAAAWIQCLCQNTHPETFSNFFISFHQILYNEKALTHRNPSKIMAFLERQTGRTRSSGPRLCADRSGTETEPAERV